jgi:hypothetical protein
MQRQRVFDEDIINYIIKDGTVYLMLFNIYRGTLSTKNEFVFRYNPDFFRRIHCPILLKKPDTFRGDCSSESL